MNGVTPADVDVGDDAYIVPRADVGIRPYKLRLGGGTKAPPYGTLQKHM